MTGINRPIRAHRTLGTGILQEVLSLQAALEGWPDLPDGKSRLETGPVFHKIDATLCGHVFCSFPALVLRNALLRRMDDAGITAEPDDVLRDLDALTETTIAHQGRTFVVRSKIVGVAGKIAQNVGVRLPAITRQINRKTDTNVSS